MSKKSLVSSKSLGFNPAVDGFAKDLLGEEDGEGSRTSLNNEIKNKNDTKNNNTENNDLNNETTNAHDGGLDGKDDHTLQSSKRRRQLTAKGKEFQLNNFVAFMKSSLKRLVKQAALIKALLNGSNRDMVTNELNTLEGTYGEFGEHYARACSILAETVEANADNEEVQLTVSLLMEEADSKYLSIKEDVCSWMINLEKIEMAEARPASVRSGSRCKSKCSKASSYRVPAKPTATNILNAPSVAGSDKSAGSRRSSKSRSSRSSSHCSDLSLQPCRAGLDGYDQGRHL